MKKTLLTIVLAVTTLLGNAADINPLVSAYAGTAMTLNFKTWKASYVEIAIIDQNGSMVFSEKTSSKSNKVYDLYQLPDGIYKVDVQDDIKKVSQVITMNNGSIALADYVNVVYKPMITFTDNIAKLNFLTLGQDATISLINDATGEVIWSEDVINKATINKAYNFKNVAFGKYTFMINTTTDSFYHSVIR